MLATLQFERESHRRATCIPNENELRSDAFSQGGLVKEVQLTHKRRHINSSVLEIMSSSLRRGHTGSDAGGARRSEIIQQKDIEMIGHTASE
ncbi:hypothetical protein PoB_005313900 [Plakobranchus ocellatus]|uniref:Uncharacterized protein n=1 Tax=Plakobranchus ocellatus TaxID=259542 RepID=A0AAV4C6F6_9GAST|nr:hypothetical protein PoB_005313900 [Plakobranchus ocellatus]